jgi:hypothetical protein
MAAGYLLEDVEISSNSSSGREEKEGEREEGWGLEEKELCGEG